MSEVMVSADAQGMAEAAAELFTEAAAGAGAARGRALVGLTGGSSAPPRFDLVLLGLGNDGHICSLFAGTDEATEKGDALLVRAVAAPTAVEPRVRRITLTPSPVITSRTIVLMTTGAKKADVLTRALR